MNPDPALAKLGDLETLLGSIGAAHELGVALSGGVDSLTLAAAAHGVLGRRAAMYHARSPAVPPEATARVQAMAAERGWRLQVFDAGEFGRAEYLARPLFPLQDQPVRRHQCTYYRTAGVGHESR
jgi:pyridinium-3,5-biscarboxylic acid mononucleotide sulfurtransferase